MVRGEFLTHELMPMKKYSRDEMKKVPMVSSTLPRGDASLMGVTGNDANQWRNASELKACHAEPSEYVLPTPSANDIIFVASKVLE